MGFFQVYFRSCYVQHQVISLHVGSFEETHMSSLCFESVAGDPLSNHEGGKLSLFVLEKW